MNNHSLWLLFSLSFLGNCKYEHLCKNIYLFVYLFDGKIYYRYSFLKFWNIIKNAIILYFKIFLLAMHIQNVELNLNQINPTYDDYISKYFLTKHFLHVFLQEEIGEDGNKWFIRFVKTYSNKLFLTSLTMQIHETWLRSQSFSSYPAVLKSQNLQIMFCLHSTGRISV